MQYKYEVLDKKEVYHGFFKLTKYVVDFEYFTGQMSGPLVRESLGKGGVVAALVYDPQKDLFVFVKQFRIGMMEATGQPWNLEIVAGMMDKPNETPEKTILREMNEEIGVYADKVSFMCEYYASPGSSASKNYIYFAEVNADNIKPYTGMHEEGEDISVLTFPRIEVMQWLVQGKIDNAMMLIALQYFALNENKFI